MRQLYLLITFPFIMLYVCSGLQAQTKLYVHAKDGDKASFSLNEIRKLTFPNRTIVLLQNDRSVHTFPFIELRQARFTEFVSKNKSIDLTDDRILTLFPNPVHNELNISMSSSIGSNIEIWIIEVQGKTVSLRKEHILPGNNTITIPLSELPQGLYLCRVTNGKSTETRKFLKN